ncbi:c-type cytochrome [Pacificoceanicola onchidii]|uniref:c-type cytochrome n=1 Tax=Pacificoceanicola onchidii TaxID=2562685 RepID=UPI0010A5D426|nr:cytochrome c [Pacificoceanicola onchidii]
MKRSIALIALLSTLGGTAAIAQDTNAHLKARQGQFRILALNLGVLGGMAKGAIEYDAAVAQAAADSVAGVAMVHQATLFPEGTDAMSLDGTRADPGIWDNFDDFNAKWAALGEAAMKAKETVGSGKDAIGPALGMLGGTCKGCHDTYRTPE